MKNKKLYLIIFLGIIFSIISFLVLNKKDMYIDNYIYQIISGCKCDTLTYIIKFITYLGSAVVVISINLLILIVLKNKKYGLFLALDLICITIFQLILKNIFCRTRPIGIGLIEEDGYSFPSGHTLTSVSFYGLLIYFIYNSNINKRYKKILITLLVSIIFLVGFSRIYLGVHYFTDVIGAISFSIIYITIYINIIKKYI